MPPAVAPNIPHASHPPAAGRAARGGTTLAEEAVFVSGVSGRYASALFALAQERVQTAEVAEALQDSTP